MTETNEVTNDMQMLKAFLLIVFVALVVLIFTGEFTRYGGHNGYQYLFSDLKAEVCKDADLNNEGLITDAEIKEAVHVYIKSKRLLRVDNRFLLLDQHGNKLTATEAAEALGLK
jgi:hypothetical protein